MRLSDILSGNADDWRREESASRYALAYARVSTDDQEKAGLSIPAQIREVEAFGRAKGITILEFYQEAESAFSDESKRPEFWQMVERAKRDPKITCILVHEFSRFYRDPYAGPMVKGELLAHGIRVVSATEPEYDPRTIAGLAIEKMTEFKNASYSLDVAFHTQKGMRENIQRRDQEVGYCYKNGGTPPWGLKAYRVERGNDRRGIPIVKTLWEKDDTVIAGRAVWEWTRHILIELRLGQHASLDDIRDFLNENGIPATRKEYWGTSSIHAILQPHVLLQYAGYGVWNVRGKYERHRPPSQWQVVENAHPAIITMEEAEAIMAVNQRQSERGAEKSKGRMAQVRTENSRYLLTGGLFTCKRCGENMVGYHNQGRLYYVCGSKAYRRGLGCGEGLQVRKEEIEAAVIEEVRLLFTSLTDTKRVLELVNEGVRSANEQNSAEAVEISRETSRVDQEIANIRQAIKSGLQDMEWANEELRRLKVEKDDLAERQRSLEVEPRVPEVDMTRLEEYRRRFAEVLETGTNKEKREFARLFVRKIEIDPDTWEVWISLFGLPPAVTQPQMWKRTPAEARVPIGLGAGVGFEPTTFGL